MRRVLEGVGQFVRLAGDLHAAPAAARRRLDDHRVSDLVCDPERLGRVLDGAFGAGHAGDAEPRRGALGLDLVAHQADVLGLRTDECDLVLVEDIGEPRVLGQEAVARVNGVRAGDLAGGDDGGNVEIAVLRGGGPMHTLSSASLTCIASLSAVE